MRFKRDWILLTVVLLSLSLFSCSKDKAKVDADVIIDTDIEIDIDNLAKDEDVTDEETVSDNDETENADIDEDSSCLDLKDQSNVLKSGFPLKDENGKITFCRPNCDTVTANDPQCIRNLWEWNNWGVYQTYLKDKENTSPECYPWPCIIPEMKAYTKYESSCDRGLSVKSYESSMGTTGDLKVSEGIAGIEMGGYVHGYNALRAMAYHVEKDQFEPVGYTGALTGYNYGRFIFMTANGDWSEETYTQTYIVTAKRNDDGTWKYELAYDNDEHHARFSRQPFVGKDWVLIQVQHGKGGYEEVFYSKIGEWNWHKFTLPDGYPQKVYEGNISGDNLTFIVGERDIYVCSFKDLPSSLEDCREITREGELGHGPRLDALNENRLVYNIYGEAKFVDVDMSTEPFIYTEHTVTPSETNALGFEPTDFRKGIVLYSELLVSSGNDFKACFYSMSEKKSYCPDKSIWSDKQYVMGFGTFDGNYMLWKAPAMVGSYLRDIKCWCRETGKGCETLFGE